MRTTQHILLGISPGTRIIGIALWKQGQLQDARIKSFTGSWTESKLKDILFAMQNIITDNDTTTIAIKKPASVRSSPALTKLVSEPIILAKRKKIAVHTYSFNELKQFYSDDRTFTKADLIKAVAMKYPELRTAYNREQSNHNRYYTKMFEAITAAEICASLM